MNIFISRNLKTLKFTLDINKIFGAFGSSSRDEGFNHLPSSFNIPFTIPLGEDVEHPLHCIKMFEKLIVDDGIYFKQLLSFFDKSNEDLEVGELEDVSKSLLYDRAFNYIKKIDLKDKYHLKILAEHASPQLEISLNKAIEYHEDEEEYEKCALLKQYLDFINFSSYLNNK